jgi:anti-repressor protein
LNELLNVTINENHEPVMSARDLHEFLEIGTAYNDWFPRMVEYGFAEEIDFHSILSKSTGGRPGTDHIIKLDMAKEIAMIQRSDKGKTARQYFLQIEKEWNSPEKVMARALLMADKKIHVLESQIEADKPKVLFADAVSASSTSILIGELAKLLRQNGIEIGQNRLFEDLRNKGYLIKRVGGDWNMPTQRSMELGLFEIKEHNHTDGNGCNITKRTTKVTGRGQQYFINKYLGQATA